jgi:hypothetical protein
MRHARRISNMTREFEAKLERPEGVGTWTFVSVPFNVEEAYDIKSKIKVKGTVNGIPFRSSLMPSGDGTHFLVVNKSIRDAAGVSSGDIVHVAMEHDTDVREVIIPDDLKNALEVNENARGNFEQLSYSHKKEFVDWIGEAKREETHAKRIETTLLKLSGRKTLK